MVGTTSLKNKNYEEIYGIRRAKEMRKIKKMRLTEWHRKNKNTKKYKRRGENISKALKGRTSPNKLDLPENEIVNIYLNQNISGNKIAKRFNCSPIPIYRILKENNIKTKGTSFFNKGKPSKKRIIKNEQEVIDMYNQNLSGTEIAKKFNCSNDVIYGILKRNCIEIKGTKYFNKGKQTWNKDKKIDMEKYPNFGMKNKNHSEKTKKLIGIKRLGKPQYQCRREDIDKRKDEILDLYDKDNSVLKISKIVRCSERVIERILKENNIKIRPRKYYKQTEEVKQILRQYKGERAVNWQGGISFEPYGLAFNKELKKQIRKRDNFTCQECGKLQNKLRRKLDIHHIDYNKKNNSIFNLISLCQRCHGKTHFNRKHWTNHFKMKIFLIEFFNPKNIKVFNENRQLIAMEIIK